MNRTGAQLISLQSCSSSGLQAEDNVNVITMLPRWRLVHDLVGRVVLGRCGTHFGVQESMHWTSKLRKCEGRVGRGLCCVGGGEPSAEVRSVFREVPGSLPTGTSESHYFFRCLCAFYQAEPIILEKTLNQNC